MNEMEREVLERMKKLVDTALQNNFVDYELVAELEQLSKALMRAYMEGK